MTTPQHFLIYQSEDGSTRLDVRLDDETLWLSQKQLTELFGKAKGTISEHIKHIFEDGEWTPEATVRLFRTVQMEGGREVVREVEHYNLDMVLALGFRVRSPVGVRFRRWATDKLKEYIVKGFVLDDARLKNPGKGADYFDELTRRLQDIRTSERRFYQKITDIYATSVDYDAAHPLTQQFFATVQNKVHFAIHGQTAAELITARANSSQPHMGLTNWEGARIRKADVSVAKNYLNEGELRALNNLAEQYLIFAEGQAARRIAMTMQSWIAKLEGFSSSMTGISCKTRGACRLTWPRRMPSRNSISFARGKTSVWSLTLTEWSRACRSRNRVVGCKKTAPEGAVSKLSNK